jgi:hypothetical protein
MTRTYSKQRWRTSMAVVVDEYGRVVFAREAKGGTRRAITPH